MPFNGTSSTISSATDVFFNSPANGKFVGYNEGSSKWGDQTLNGVAALANAGGSETVSTNTAATGAVTLNLANGNVFNVVLTGNVTFTFSGATNGKACAFTLYKSQNATGGRTVTWPASVKWAGGTAPTLTTSASTIDILVFESVDGGNSWFGSLVGANFS